MTIFCLGLSRTGTTSLHAASLILRIPAIHYPIELVPKWLRGDFSPASTRPFEFISDLPTPLYFEEFDKTHPGARFILTYRDDMRWLDSVEKHFKATPASSAATAPRDIIRIACYGTSVFNRQRMHGVYRRHFDRVIDYFAARPKDFLAINLEEERDAWQVLCAFLQMEKPAMPFPHLRSPNIGTLRWSTSDDLEAKRDAILGRLSEVSLTTYRDGSVEYLRPALGSN
jgi:hypothetical protein